MAEISMSAEICAFRAEAFVAMNNHIEYVSHPHTGPQHSKPCTVHVPKHGQKWDWGSTVMAYRDLDDPECILSRCRCGYVFNCIYFQRRGIGDDKLSVAVKLMDKQLIQLENDDIESEIRIMRVLQPMGFTLPLVNKHMLHWELAECKYNHYLATDLISNGSLISFMQKSYSEIRSNLHRTSGSRAHPNELGRNVGLWFLEKTVFPMFYQILCGLAYIHSQYVCHLDFDPYNIAVDKDSTVRILDFGSSQIMDGRQCVGGGRDFPQIKSKLIYRSPELRKNNRDRSNYIRYLRTRSPNSTFREEQQQIPPGFNGAKSDIFSAGVVCLEMTLFGFRFPGCPGQVFVSMQNPQYREQFRHHFANSCQRNTCIFCAHALPIPPFVFEMISYMMTDNPADRKFDAVELAIMWKKNVEKYKNRHQTTTAASHITPSRTKQYAAAC